MKQLILILTIFSYSLASLIRLRGLKSTEFNDQAISYYSFWASSLIAVLGHGYLLFDGVFLNDSLNLGVFKAMSLVGWTIVLLIQLTAIKKPVEILTIVLYPLAILTSLLDYLLPSHLNIPVSGSWQLQAHIFISITAYSFLTIAVVQSIVLAIQDHQIHNRQPAGFIQSLPPLQLMEQLLFQIITIGFILLTVGLLIGALFLQDITAQHLVHKTVLSSLAWAIFAILLWGRWRFGWRGRRAIRLALAGFIALMLAFMGTKIVIELILQRGIA